jgi:hypothetical protein
MELPPDDEEEEQGCEEEHTEPQREPSAQMDPEAPARDVIGGKAIAHLEKEGSMVIIEFNGVHEFEIARLSALTVWGRILPKAATVNRG